MYKERTPKFKHIMYRFVFPFMGLIIFLLVVGVAAMQWNVVFKSSSSGLTHDHQQHGTLLAEEKTLYTCGMHPQVIQEGPGICPICNMELTPLKKKSANVSSQNKRKIKYWVAPMDPTYISDKPGKSPMGMDLVPVYKDGDEGSDGKTITIDPVVVQNMGVRVEHVKRGSISKKIRTIGDIEVAEDELSVINLRFSGWLEKVFVDKTGQYIRKGDSLFEIYSPELLSAQEELLLAIRTTKGGMQSKLAQSAERRLELFGIPDTTIKNVIKNKRAAETIIIRAPQSGYILHKNVVEGAHVKAGNDLYRIGNLNKIWVMSEIYENDVPWLQLGQKATMELSLQPGKLFEGNVSYIYPTLNTKTRTVTVRMEYKNKDLILKPGMFATIRIEAQKTDGVLLVPTEAVIRTGEKNVVFVTPELGKYEPREVITGLVGDNRKIEIRSGLDEGDAVVISGQFLLDSESQLQEAVQKLLEARLQKSQKTVAHDLAEHNHEGMDTGKNEQETYWTCSMHPTIVQDGPGTCPICGMDLVEMKK